MPVKMMQREVTSTKIVYGQLKVVEGLPQVQQDEKTFVGNISEEKALKILSKELGSGVTILSVEVETQVYEMPVSDFIKLAKIKVVQEKVSE